MSSGGQVGARGAEQEDQDAAMTFVKMARAVGVPPKALLRALVRLVVAGDEDDQDISILSFWTASSGTGTDLGSQVDSSPGTPLSQVIYPYAVDGGGGLVEMTYNGGAGGTLLVTSPRGDDRIHQLAEDSTVEVRLPVVNGTVLTVEMPDGGVCTFTGNPDGRDMLQRLESALATVSPNAEMASARRSPSVKRIR